METSQEQLARETIAARKRQAWLGVVFVVAVFALWGYYIWLARG